MWQTVCELLLLKVSVRGGKVRDGSVRVGLFFGDLGGTVRVAYTSKVRPNLNNFFSVSKLLVVVLEPVSVEELVSVEDAPSADFA